MENKRDGGMLWMYKIREKNKDTRKCILCMINDLGTPQLNGNGKDQIEKGR